MKRVGGRSPALGLIFVLTAVAAVARADDLVMIQAPQVAPSVTAAPTAEAINQAVPRDAFRLLPGFQVERLFTVPKETCGSWIAITTDPKGRLVASDQAGSGLYRIAPSPIGTNEPTRVERLTDKVSSAQGLLFAFDSLYVVHNGKSALFRLRDTDGDDQFDEVTKLCDLPGGGEHGPHGLRLSPDGRQIYLIAGNHSAPPLAISADPPQRLGGVRDEQRHATIAQGCRCRLSPNWDEDLLLPRQWDAGGHAIGLLAPAGWIAACDQAGTNWDLRTIGFRNAYDIALNADGELFAYDSDPEWDMGTPWYRPTRILHATAGADHGWRAGYGCWPEYRADSLPAAVHIGPGSPVGLEFGYGTRFPAKYQKALFALDWTYGTIYATHLTAEGASYTGTREEFLSRSPLPLTDATVGHDGALYFLTGGRGIQSELFRVRYVGAEPTEQVDARDAEFAELRALRKRAEAYLAAEKNPADAAERLIPLLAHADRHIRYAARVGLERLPPEHWQTAVLAASEPDTVISGVLALAHVVDGPEQPALLAALDRLDFSALSGRQKLDALRAWELTFIRLGRPGADVAARLAEKLDRFYPAAGDAYAGNSAESDFINRELCDLLVFLHWPSVAAKTVALLKQPSSQPTGPTSTAPAAPSNREVQPGSRGPTFAGDVLAMLTANPPDVQKIWYVYSLRTLDAGWQPQDRIDYFDWLHREYDEHESSTYRMFLKNVEQDAYDRATEPDRLAIDASGVRRPWPRPVVPKPIGPGRPRTLDELIALWTAHPTGHNFAGGQRAFAAARCAVCHRFAGDGGSTGPDLTQAAGRFTVRDLAESLVEPNKVVSDQYRATRIETADGHVYVGRITSGTPDSITLQLDPEDASRWVNIASADIEKREPSPISLMPADLLSALNDNEVLDLLAYLLSRGNPQDAMFGR